MEHVDIISLGTSIADFIKQIITLNTGMIVLIIAIVEKVFMPQKFSKNKVWFLLFLIISLLGFIISLGASLFGLADMPANIVIMLKDSSNKYWVDNSYFYTSIYSFLGGIVSFFVLAILSFITHIFNSDQEIKGTKLINQ
jgi:hypothetical protein